MRHALAALLIFVLALAGAGRGFPAAGEAPASVALIGGVVAPICHAGAASEADPAGPGGHAHHDCCDACALCVAFILTTPPTAGDPAAFATDAPSLAVAVFTARVARLRTPRQSQGPPAA